MGKKKKKTITTERELTRTSKQEHNKKNPHAERINWLLSKSMFLQATNL